VYYGIQDREEQLLPERILASELGLHDQSTLFHEADVAVYFNRVTNLLYLQEPAGQLAPYSQQYGGYIGAVGDYINQQDVYLSYGAELDLSVYPVSGVDIFANFTWQNLLREYDGDGAFVLDDDQSYSMFKTNMGVAYRSNFRMDFSTDVGYASDQRWAISVADAQGEFQTEYFDTDFRLQWNARIAARPFSEERLEVGVIGWNILGFTRPVKEHGEGQPVSGRLLGSVSYTF